MEKHYIAPDLEICRFRLTDVVMVSKDDDDWEIIIKKKPTNVLTPQQELGNGANSDGLYYDY